MWCHIRCQLILISLRLIRLTNSLYKIYYQFLRGIFLQNQGPPFAYYSISLLSDNIRSLIRMTTCPILTMISSPLYFNHFRTKRTRAFLRAFLCFILVHILIRHLYQLTQFCYYLPICSKFYKLVAQ